MYRNPNYQKEYQKKYSTSEKGIEIRNKANLKYLKSDKFKETRKKYTIKNKEKKKEWDRNYYFNKTKYKRVSKKKEKIVNKPIISIVNKPIVLDFS